MSVFLSFFFFSLPFIIFSNNWNKLHLKWYLVLCFFLVFLRKVFFAWGKSEVLETDVTISTIFYRTINTVISLNFLRWQGTCNHDSSILFLKKQKILVDNEHTPTIPRITPICMSICWENLVRMKETRHKCKYFRQKCPQIGASCRKHEQFFLPWIT